MIYLRVSIFIIGLSLWVCSCHTRPGDPGQVGFDHKLNFDPTNKISFQPNIVWLVAEDLSPIIPPYGDSTVSTPNLDRLAREGVTYTNVFSPSGVCAPSRFALATGLYPSSAGAHNMRVQYVKSHMDQLGLVLYEVVPPPEVKMMSQILREYGYYCTNNDKTDYQFQHPVTSLDESSTKAHWRNRPAGKPFFSVFNFGVTHEGHVSQPYRKQLLRYYDPDFPDIDTDTPRGERIPEEELFDTWNDPHELHNLAEDPAYAGKLAELRHECDRWMKNINDMGHLPEHEILETFWPDRKQPVTRSPEYQINDGAVVLHCPTPGASIGVKLITKDNPENEVWQVYTKPILIKENITIIAKAHRLGYAPSEIIKFGFK